MKNKKSQKRIGIDARFFGPRQKGLGRYVQKLVEYLEKVDSDNQYLIFLRRENWSEYRPTNPNFKKVLADYRWYGLKEQLFLPVKIRRAKVDLMHFPHFNVPLLCFRPFVVTLHDLILKRFPTSRASTLSPARYYLKNLAYRLVIFSAVRRAQKIIAVSQHTKKDILEHFKVRPEKIEVIYEGAPEAFVPKGDLPETPEELEKNGHQRPYLLYVGNAYPHKNLEKLILAFERLNRPEYQLVLVGEMDFFYRRLKKFVERSDLSAKKAVIFAGFVPDQRLKALFQDAALYVFPSLCEGFGLPPLEAMAYGCPVVSSQATCLPEILGEAAVYFNPAKEKEIAGKIEYLLKEPSARRKMVKRGYRQIKQYDWLKTARQTAALYLKG